MTDLKNQPLEPKMKEFLKKNYLEYTNSPLKIGFTNSFPENKKNIKDQMIVDVEGYGKVSIRLGMLKYGDKKSHQVLGIITDPFKIEMKGGFGRWHSYGFEKEAEAMKLAVIKMAAKHALMVHNIVCSWPFAKVVVGEPTKSHLDN